MKNLRFILAVIAITVFSVGMTAVSLSAQPNGPRPQFGQGGPNGPHKGEMPSPEKIAEKRTKMLEAQLRLDNKQYKKIYKIFLKEEKAREAAREEAMFPGGFPGGPGMPDGFPGMMPGEMAKPAVGGKELDSPEYIEARDKKFMKILTADQYRKYIKL